MKHHKELEYEDKLYAEKFTQLKAFSKPDEGKTEFDELPWGSIEDVARLMTLTSKDRPNKNYLTCTDLNRYLNALCRHVVAYQQGERVDKDTGESPLVHIAANALILIELEKRNEES